MGFAPYRKKLQPLVIAKLWGEAPHIALHTGGFAPRYHYLNPTAGGGFAPTITW